MAVRVGLAGYGERPLAICKHVNTSGPTEAGCGVGLLSREIGLESKEGTVLFRPRLGYLLSPRY